MIKYDINAIIVATMAMSVTAASMAWSMILVAVRQWAERREALYRDEVIGVEKEG